MPAYEPVSQPYSHPFRARCSVCGSRDHPAHELATGRRPWSYIGRCCQDNATRERVVRAADIERRNWERVVARCTAARLQLSAERQGHHNFNY